MYANAVCGEADKYQLWVEHSSELMPQNSSQHATKNAYLHAPDVN